MKEFWVFLDKRVFVRGKSLWVVKSCLTIDTL